MSREIGYLEALNEALLAEMARDPSIVIVGENIRGGFRPETKGIEDERLPNGTLVSAVNTPPEWRLNTALTFNSESWYGSLGLNYQDDAFWTDVLDSRFWGPTDSFAQVNTSIGYRFSENFSLAVNGQNIFDEDVQQHVFGDIISRKITGILHYTF